MNGYTDITIYFDIETAGLEIDAPIIEVAAVAVESATYREVSAIDMKIEFEMKNIDYKALGINKFSAETWTKYAFPSEVAAQKLERFFSRYATVEKVSKKTGKSYTISKLAGHNSNAFDAPRIKNLFDKHELFFHPAMLRTLDTEQKARWFFEDNPGITQPENYKLGTLIKHLGITNVDADHTALADTRATVELARSLAEFRQVTATAEAA